jgi:hypothetical protein
MPDPVAVATGVGASFMAAGALIATWEIRRARAAFSTLYDFDREEELISGLDIAPNQIRRFKVWLSAEDGEDIGARDVERYIEIAVAVDERLERSKAANRARLKAAAAASDGIPDRKCLRRMLQQWLSSDVSGYRAIRALNRELSPDRDGSSSVGRPATTSSDTVNYTSLSGQ